VKGCVISQASPDWDTVIISHSVRKSSEDGSCAAKTTRRSIESIVGSGTVERAWIFRRGTPISNKRNSPWNTTNSPPVTYISTAVLKVEVAYLSVPFLKQFCMRGTRELFPCSAPPISTPIIHRFGCSLQRRALTELEKSKTHCSSTQTCPGGEVLPFGGFQPAVDHWISRVQEQGWIG